MLTGPATRAYRVEASVNLAQLAAIHNTAHGDEQRPALRFDADEFTIPVLPFARIVLTIALRGSLRVKFRENKVRTFFAFLHNSFVNG